jgi:hypothetical protein
MDVLCCLRDYETNEHHLFRHVLCLKKKDCKSVSDGHGAGRLSFQQSDVEDDEVRSIVYNGDPNNRIDIVVMAEGYSADEKESFFGDVSQLSVDLFVEGTFGAWAPIFNIWGIYRESADTGIGTRRAPRATAFGVHKEESDPSALFVSNIHAARYASSATGPNAFDYTIIITNEDFQGSLGGEFLVLPKSLLTSSEEVCKGTFILNVYDARYSS